MSFTECFISSMALMDKIGIKTPLREDLLPPLALSNSLSQLPAESSPCWRADEPPAVSYRQALLAEAASCRPAEALQGPVASQGGERSCAAEEHQEAQRSWPPESRAANTEKSAQRPCFALLSPSDYDVSLSSCSIWLRRNK